MTAKEWNEHLVAKWDFMLEPLDQKKTSRARYARMFEQTTLHTNTSTVKLALPLLQKILYTIPDVKVSSSTKTSLLIGEFEKDFVLDGNAIMPDGAASFIDYMANIVDEKKEDISKLSHIMLGTDQKKIRVYLIC